MKRRDDKILEGNKEQMNSVSTVHQRKLMAYGGEYFHYQERIGPSPILSNSMRTRAIALQEACIKDESAANITKENWSAR